MEREMVTPSTVATMRSVARTFFTWVFAGRSVVVAAVMFAFPALLLAQVKVGAPIVTRVIVRGTVFDSLAMEPVAKATVWIPGGTQTTTADDNGKFELDDVPVGKQFIAFTSTALDSLGLGTQGTLVDVTGNNTHAQLTTPSFKKIWRLLCSDAAPASRTDSGIVWGTIRDANSDSRLSGASAGFSWYDMTVSADKKVGFREQTHEVRTDSTGTYYACGLPSDIKIASEATGTRSASGTMEYVIGLRRLYRVDMLVSTDMVLQQEITGQTAADTALAMRPHGSAILHGIVRDTKGQPVVGANITLASVDTSARTNAAGEFTMTQLPSGSHVLQVRQIGFSPATMLVELRPSQTTSVTLDMPSARTLAAVNVRGEYPGSREQEDFNYRRRRGMGYFLTEKDLNNKFDIYSTMQTLPGVQIVRHNGAATILFNVRGGKSMMSGGGSDKCLATIYLDGTRADQEQLASFPPEYFRAVEVYNNRMTVPIGFESPDCGVILLWSKSKLR